MKAPKFVDISADLHEDLRRLDREGFVRDNVEDRVLAETLRKDGYDDNRLRERFGYVPTPIRASQAEGARRSGPMRPLTDTSTASRTVSHERVLGLRRRRLVRPEHEPG